MTGPNTLVSATVGCNSNGHPLRGTLQLQHTAASGHTGEKMVLQPSHKQKEATAPKTQLQSNTM